MRQRKNKPKEVPEIEKLIKLWNDNKEAYKKKEIGNGVQKFVCKVLHSPIFNLKEGEPGKEDHKRKHEFTEEEVKKGWACRCHYFYGY